MKSVNAKDIDKQVNLKIIEARIFRIDNINTNTNSLQKIESTLIMLNQLELKEDIEFVEDVLKFLSDRMLLKAKNKLIQEKNKLCTM